METQKEKSVPIVKNFQIEERAWPPVAPLKPEVAHCGSMYDDESEMEAFLSRFSHQNQEPQQFLSCAITTAAQGYSSSNNSHLWDAGINLQQRESNNNDIEMQRRGLENYLPRWNSQGRRTKVAYLSSNPQTQAQAPAPAVENDYPYLSSWEASHSGRWKNDVLGGGEDPLSNLSFADLLAIKDNGTPNAAFLPTWNPNHSSTHASSMFFNPHIFGEKMQNCGSLPEYQSLCNATSPLKNINAKNSNFSPATPDIRWRIDNNVTLENTPLGACNQVPTKLNEEQDVAAAMINLQNVIDTVPNADSSSDKVSMAVENHDPEKGGDQVIDLNKTPQKKRRRRRYQPKVLSEKKPRKTPIPKTPKPTETSEVKRKYVRKKKVDDNTTPTTPPSEVNEAGETTPREVNEAGETKPTEVNEVGDTKYVQKKKVDENTTPTTPPREVNEAGETTPREVNEAGETKPTEVNGLGDTKPAEKAAAKSCRRSLNFDLNGQAAESNFTDMSNGDAYAEAQGKCDTERNQDNDTGHHRQGVELVVEASRGGIAYDLNCALHQELENYLSLPTNDFINNSLPDRYAHSKRKENTPNTLLSSNAEILSRSDAPHQVQSPNSSPCASSSERKNRRGSKRGNPCTGDVDSGSMGPTLCNFWQPNHAFLGNANIGELQKFLLPETCKKKRTEKVQRSHVPSTSFSVPPGDLNQAASAQNHPSVAPSASKYYCCDPSPFGIDVVTNNHNNVPMERVQNRLQLMNSWADLARLKKKRSKGTTRVRDLAQLMGIASVLPVKPIPKVPPKKTDVSENAYTEGLAAGSSANPRSKRRSRKQNSENKQLSLVLYNGYRSAIKTTALPWASTSSIEEITEWMKKLDISNKNCNTKRKRRIKKGLLHQNALQEQNALVPYRAHKQEQNALVVYGRDGTMVPFDGPFDPVRKRRQRAKVDLDDETTKVWKLLLENIDNKGIDGTDEDKAKWWENERCVFRGRVDSFIARMRLVQGDRRFTPWKGSVLDSVIGVFLTQNVSDHLSSSAFMSLAAHFPLKSEGSESTISEESVSALVVEPDVCVIEPGESIFWNEKTKNQQILSSNSRIISDIDHSEEKEVVNSKELTGKTPGSVSPKDCTSESSQKSPSSIVSNANSQTIASILGDDRAKDDATSSQHSVMSSQNSTNSPNPQTVGMMSIFSESESRTQPLTTSSQSNYLDCSTSFLGLLKMAESPFLHESYNQTQQQSLECMNHVKQNFPYAQGTGSSNYLWSLNYQFPKGFEMLEVDSKSPDSSRKDENNTPTEQSNLTTESTVQQLMQEKSSDSIHRTFTENVSCYVLEGEKMVMHTQSVKEPSDTNASSPNIQTSSTWKRTNFTQVNADVTESTTELKRTSCDQKEVQQFSAQTYASGGISDMMNANASKSKTGKAGKGKNNSFDWDSLRREAQPNGQKREKTANTRDSLDWEAVRHADVGEIAEVIKERGMNNMLAERIKALLDRLVKEHGSIDMEWLRDIPPDKAKEFLLSFRGLGLKSVECVRLLTLHHLAFPVDTNVGRIAVRLGWVPLQPLPESLQLHLLELYPVLESIQKYLWPRLCKLDQKTLYELHYHLITFGKVFCTKRQPNCNACPLRAECRHFASAFASARFALPGTEEKSIMPSCASSSTNASSQASNNLLALPPALSNQYQQNNPRCVNVVPTIEASPSPLALPLPQAISHLERQSETTNCEPIVEVPASPEPEPEPELEQKICDIEDTFYEDPNEIPTITLSMKELSQTIQTYIHTGESNALVTLTPEAASIPTPKLKNINRLRTEHHVYELPDTHPLLKGLDKREPDDPCSYLLAIWTPGETADSVQPPERRCNAEDPNILCNEDTCSYCNSLREANSHIVRGTLLIPCRTAMRGSFPLNGTYFQVNEVFADHDSSLSPIAVPRSWLWNLPRRTVYFGTSIPTIFRGLTTEDIQHCFWRGFVCVRGFDQKTRAPRPLMARLHFPASKMKGAKGRAYDE